MVRIRTAVVLPAPFGPSRPKTLPCLDAEVDAAKGFDVAVALAQAGGLDGGAGTLSTLAAAPGWRRTHSLAGVSSAAIGRSDQARLRAAKDAQ